MLVAPDTMIPLWLGAMVLRIVTADARGPLR